MEYLSDLNDAPHPPNPAVASNLSALRAEVRESRADLGVAYDGDGDRVAFVDERGEPVENDRIIVLLARAALADRPAATIVCDQKCSDVVREEITRAGGIAQTERSGYAFIKTALLQTGAAYAGELSGHHFFAGIGGDDGLIASLKTAALLQASAGTFSQIVAAIPRYPITPDIRLRMPPEEVDAIIAALRRDLSAIEINTMDGVHARFADGWGMARASVTESAITLRFEGRTPEALKRIRRAFAEAAPQLAGKL